MTLSDTRQRTPTWSVDPLLGARVKTQRPRFLRSSWDEASAQNFGPWRFNDRIDPADNQGAPAPSLMDSPAAPDGPVQEAARVEAGTQDSDLTASTDSDQGTGTPLPDPDMVKGLEEAAYKRGVLAGRQLELDALKTQRDQDSELIRNLGIELRSLQQDPERFFEPMRKLALHLAETLVRNELQTSPQAIQALIEACLGQLDTHGEPVTVSLNPADLRLIQSMGDSVNAQLNLVEDPDLRSGSVRAQFQDSVVQDLIDHRLEVLARKLLSDPQSWLERSTLLNDVVDALPDDTPGRKWQKPEDDVTDVPDEPHSKDTP